MLILLTKKGLSVIDLTELKLISQFKGWKCEVGRHVYNIEFCADEITFESSTCGAKGVYNIGDFKPIENNEELIACPYDNCFCGTDMEIPKGKTLSHLRKLKNLCNFLNKEKLAELPYYDGKEEILAVGHSYILLYQKLTVEWFLGKRCNFNCSYCPPWIHDNTSPFPSWEKVRKSYDFLLGTIKNQYPILGKNRIGYYFHGGEPTLIPFYLDFLKIIKKEESTHWITTLTNLSRSPNYFYELNKVSDISYSVHLEYLTDKFIQKVDKILGMRDEKSERFLVKVMYLREYRDRIRKLIEVVKPYKDVHISIHPLQDKETHLILDYDDEDKKYFLPSFIYDQ